MAVNMIDAQLLARMFLAGAYNLDANKELINELNVFPVPDGDTGTNMTMTIMSAVGEIRALEDPTMKELFKAISSGSLRGARGNSGVILSQLFRGFTKSLKGQDMIDVSMLADACEKAVETAYKAVMKPKEGTILTVAKGMAEIARSLSDAQMPLEEYMRSVVDYGNQVLDRTPEMLPVLKEAGVVDSGGKGLMMVLEGAYAALIGKEILPPEEQKEEAVSGKNYCVELIVKSEKTVTPAQIDELSAFLAKIGENSVVVPSEDGFRLQVDTDDPGLVLTKAVSCGELSETTVDNIHLHREHRARHEKVYNILMEEYRKKTESAEPPKAVGFVAVAAGEGFSEIFEGLGVDVIISGGQTMNPSTEDVLNAVDKVNAENVFIFPNNKNIILAANQAKELVQEKNVIVIPTKTIPQGISAMISYDPEADVIENRSAMEEAVGLVRTGELTYAVRDTTIDEVVIHQGDIMAVGDSGILCVGREIADVAVEAVGKMLFDDAALVSVYFGKEYSEENANRLAGMISETYPDVDVEVNYGGQPVYYCILSVE